MFSILPTVSERERGNVTLRSKTAALRIDSEGRKAPAPHLSALVCEGDPAEIIAAESRTTSQDLLILGSPYPSVLSWLLGTSIVHRVIVESACPVITIRPRGTSDDFS